MHWREKMSIESRRVELRDIEDLRDIYRQEMSCQIIHDSIHSRPGWSEEYLLIESGAKVGYGSVAVGGPWHEKPTLYEFFVLPQYRLHMFDLFSALLTSTAATMIETQSNDPLLTAMLHTWAHNVVSERIIFEDKLTTAYRIAGAALRRREPEGDWMLLEVGGEVAATGGILYHYNRPYGDIWMEVAEPFRLRGYGTYLVQELKRLCYEAGNIPCARCGTDNVASRRTLQKAGFVPCAHILAGKL